MTRNSLKVRLTSLALVIAGCAPVSDAPTADAGDAAASAPDSGPLRDNPYARPIGPAGGDLGSSYPGPQVIGIHGNTLPGPSGTNTALMWNGSSLNWTNPSSGSVSISGSGLAHATTGTLDSVSYLGTAGQFVATNAAANNSSWVSCAGDVSCSTSTPGSFTVSGLQGHSVPGPTGIGTTLAWSGSSFSWTSTTAGISQLTGQVTAGPGVGAQAATITAGTLGQLFVTEPGPVSGWATAAGDIQYGGSAGTYDVVGFQGRSVSATAPTVGQAYIWNGSAWTPGSAGGGSTIGFTSVVAESSSFSAVANTFYQISAGAPITMTIPVLTVGQVVGYVDLLAESTTNNITITPPGSVLLMKPTTLLYGATGASFVANVNGASAQWMSDGSTHYHIF